MLYEGLIYIICNYDPVYFLKMTLLLKLNSSLSLLSLGKGDGNERGNSEFTNGVEEPGQADDG